MSDTVTVRRIAFELTIDAPRQTVWQAMVEDIGDWWPADYRATADATAFHFEAHPGGRVWEETVSGGLQWFTVQALEAGRSANLAGFIGPPWGGPSVTTLYLALRDHDDGGCVLAVTDASFGELASGGEVESGWRTIFGALADHVREQVHDKN